MLKAIKNSYQHTVYACFTGYVVQAIVNNFAPLLFVTLAAQYGISMEQISVIISVNFGVQLAVDLLSPLFIDRIGYRASAVLAHVFSAAGLLLFAFLPGWMGSPFAGLLISVMVYAVGGGLLEVLISPIVEACPTKKKEAAMSLLHSFYCWGHAGVVILSTLFFALAGVENWKLMACIWAVIPVLNLIYFCLVPVPFLEAAGEESRGSGLLKNGLFWLMMLLMLCAGASEQAVSQWASTFAEKGLGVAKTVGDLAGPLTFALLMGAARVLYAKCSDRVEITKYMTASGLLCLVTYLLIAFSRVPALGLIGCGLCGFSVGVLWPGTFSLAAKRIRGGTTMFAWFALAGDLGCMSGPSLVGWAAQRAGDDLQTGILLAIVFPVLLLIGLAVAGRTGKKEEKPVKSGRPSLS